MALEVTPLAVIGAVVASLGTLGVAVIVLYLVGGRTRKVSSTDKLVLVWLIYNAFTHFVLEGSFLYYSLAGTVNESEGFLASLWKEYAKVDARWGVSDPTIVSLELLTVPSNGTLTLLLIYTILTNRPWRHFVQVVVNVCELYGGWMTFCPEWLTGNANLDSSNWFYFWVYLVFFNMLWVILPLLLLLQSYNFITTNRQTKKLN